ncbi:hypothetical protein VPNG_08670 [Cytospora leucostoma]|uniref:Beta-lactamase-related domain-containing protein n=1 Tax=Cytospora leucostoma TaxID=1230097 RepID=A0A423W3C8_9PEZI|nr:hypothetical protein VPNG_08670 [Cytospora leucostoma]
MAPPPFETEISQALADNIIPGAVLRARSKDGRLDYTKSFGPWDTTTVFPMASMTKLITSIAAAQAIERGLITLDADIAPILPALAAQPILTGFDSSSGQPILRKRQKPITLRHLLTHSYGQTYGFADPSRTGRYLETLGRRAEFPAGDRSAEETYDHPLLFEPGEAWAYGPGIDWAGLAVERVSGLALEDFVRRHVFAPLGVLRGDSTFFPARRPGLLARVARVSARDDGTGKLVPPDGEVDPSQVGFALGGSGLYATVDDYFRVVESLLLDDEKLLKKETAELLFQPQLRADSGVKLFPGVVGWTPPLAEGYTWSLAGLLTPAGNGHRGKGFLQWGGAYNSIWFIDREAGLTALLATCVSPSGDAQIAELIKKYELGIYELLRA